MGEKKISFHIGLLESFLTIVLNLGKPKIQMKNCSVDILSIAKIIFYIRKKTPTNFQLYFY